MLSSTLQMQGFTLQTLGSTLQTFKSVATQHCELVVTSVQVLNKKNATENIIKTFFIRGFSVQYWALFKVGKIYKI